MIAKHVPMNSAKKSDFAGLVRYISNAQGRQERVGQVRITNCQSDQTEIAILEVLNTQAQNTRSTADKTYHVVIGFPTGEQPDASSLDQIEQRLCAALGLGEHQRISVVHHDTDNLHVHIAINKIHPVRHTIHEPYNAYHAMGKLCARLEVEFGLQMVNHAPFKKAGENRADDMERHTAVESLLGWIKRECKSQIQEAPSWAALHAVLQGHGLHIHERANGMVITAENGTSVKASSVAREFSMTRLEQRLGRFEPGAAPSAAARPAKRYDKQPVGSRIDTTGLYARYRTAQQIAVTSRALAWSQARARKGRLVEDAKRTGHLKRAAIKLLTAPRTAKRLMYAATRSTLRDDIATVNLDYLKDRQAIQRKFQQLAWADWLKREATAGDQEALAVLRARKSGSRLKGNTVTGKGPVKRTDTDPRPDGITKKGTIIYRLGAGAVRDDGDRLTISHGSDQAALVAALRMAVARYGDCITVNGSNGFREQVVRAAVTANLRIIFDDDALERRRHQLAHSLKRKENNHGNDNDNGDGDGASAIGRRPDRSGNGRSEGTVTRTRQFARSFESHSQGARQAAPATARHGLRNLSELGVVHLAHRSEVLLPGDVPGHVERQGAQPDHGVRRRLRGAGRLNARKEAPMTGKTPLSRIGSAPPPQSQDRLRRLSQLGGMAIAGSPVDGATHSSPQSMPLRGAVANPSQISSSAAKLAANAAVEKYVIEREQKRRIGFDIPKHKRFTFTQDVKAAFAGIRVVDGQTLALLGSADEVMVLAIDDATSRRLRRLQLGRPLDVSANGVIKSKGRRR